MLCPVTSIDTPPSEVMESGNYLAVTEPCLQKTVGPPEQDGLQCVKVAFKIENYLVAIDVTLQIFKTVPQ